MNRPFCAWPGWPHLIFAWRFSLGEAAWFALVYGGCNWITAHRTWRVRLDLPWEERIPFVPGAVVPYMSVYLLFFAGPFIVRERRAFLSLVIALSLATLGGGIGFLLLPAQPSYLSSGDLGIWRGLFHFADWLNLDYNMLPSLHVALSVCCVSAYGAHAPRWGRLLLWAWAVAIGLSTLLTHQHHLLDVLSGWILGVGVRRLRMPGISRQRFAESLREFRDSAPNR